VVKGATSFWTWPERVVVGLMCDACHPHVWYSATPECGFTWLMSHRSDAGVIV
jgi:hypothetical protein